MKSIIISNCNTTAYYNYIREMFPEWDTRSVLITQADDWIKESHGPFLDFLANVDVFIGLPEAHKKISNKYLNEKAIKVILPSFLFMGTRPDCFWLPGIRSTTGSGVIHSKIAAAAFWVGKSLQEARALYSEDHYDSLGYFGCYSSSREELLASYRSVGVDLEDEFERWSSYGDFLYTPNHPQSRILFDILNKALPKEGIITSKGADFVAEARGNFDDYLAQGIIWPVYPEVSERLSLTNAKSLWRSSAAKAGGEEFDLPVMLERSYSIFSNHPDARHKIFSALGGEENILKFSGSLLST